MKRYFSILLWILLGLSYGQVHAQCKAGFTFTSKVCSGSKVGFRAKDTLASRHYSWNFGDPFSGTFNTDSARNPDHYYATAGKYTITLILSDTGGCRDTQTAIITVYSLPVADFTILNGCSGLQTKFSNTTSSDSADPIKQWLWDLGNGDTSTSKSPIHVYNSTGKVNVRLIAVSTIGCRDTFKQSITVYKKPSATRTPASICQNGQVDLNGDTISNAVLYHWDFGDSTSFTQRTGTHVYKKYGILRPVFTVDFATSSCSIKVDSVIVNRAPDARFKAVKDSLCFKNNQVCVIQKNMQQKIKSRSVIFDDGFLDDFSPLSDSVICHKYTDTAGGLYSLTVELVDSNNCTATETHKNAIRIYPQLRPAFTFTAGNGCFKTDIVITNTSNRTPPVITKYLWNFGDGNKDSAQWTNVKYRYIANGSFNISLNITDNHGCSEIYTNNKTVNNTSYVVDARIDSIKGYCRNNNTTYFKQSPIAGATILWTFTGTKTSNAFSTAYKYNFPGFYYPTVKISKNGCDSSLTLDSVVIHGPVASAFNVQNRYQCQIKDTIYFQNTSLLYLNKSAVVLWDAGDGFSATCTTNTKGNVNVGMNCNYSTDSLKFKHMYSTGKENCYWAKIRVIDTVIGCTDSAYIALALRPPIAKGLFFPSSNTNCPGPEFYKSLTFDPNIPQPSCIKYAWWIMWDSLGATKTSNFDSMWQLDAKNHNYSYSNYAGDSNGYVTIGLVVENGKDTAGNICRDTGWFHNIVKVTRVNPNFTSTYNPSVYYCKYAKHYFFLKDSFQNTGTKFLWDFGDGTSVNTTNQKYLSHVFTRAGTFRVRLVAIAPNGCTVDSSMEVNIGMYASFSTSANQKCIGDTIQLSENNLYQNIKNSPVGLWRNAARIAAGKEHIWYDLNDGTGFQDIGPTPIVKYTQPGTYLISMMARDSVGCMDTLKNSVTVKMSGIYAGFTTPSDTVLCAQTLKIKSTATVTDSNGMKTLAGDKITAWSYDFGSTYPKSATPNPMRYFATGTYKIKQIVTNVFGCKDTAEKTLNVIGPIAGFTIVSDSIGCAPLLIKFQNNSKNANNFIWQFGDINNNIFTTKSDTNVSLKYLGYGNYYPKLVAQGSFTRNGATLVCDEIYPDTSTLLKKKITVFELPKPNFKWATNCATGTTKFTNTSSIVSASLISEKWFFGDGGFSLGPNPSHTYADTGTYRVVLIIKSNQGCEDSLVRKIVVSPSPIPWFGYNYNCFGTLSLFKDSSFAYNDRIFQWNWDFGDGTTSNQRNPQKLYAKDTTYNVKLTVTNIAGCSENVTRAITVFSKPKPSFTFQNVCDKNIAFFKNNSSSKQALQWWQWKTGDGGSYTTWNDSHLYANPGSFKTKLVMQTIRNCMDSLTKTVVVYPNPVAKIFVNDSDQCYKYHKFSFTDTSNILSGTTTSSWDLGDGNQKLLRKFTYKYSNWGNYKIQLISTSNFNCKDTETANVYVFPMPLPSFSINQSDQCSRYNQYSFKETGSIGKGTYTMQWEFGDGAKTTNNPALHHYPDTGIYKPLLILQSDKGCRDSAKQIIHLWPMPKSDFSVNDSDQCLTNNKFTFTNKSKVAWGKLTHAWNFGDAKTDTMLNPVHAYLNDGKYEAMLIETSSKNCKDTITKGILVFPMPIAKYSISDSAMCLKQNTFTFKNSSSISSGTLKYLWRLGDGNTDNTSNPTHIYATQGVYKIKLIATSLVGCPDSVTHSIEVFPMPKLLFGINIAGQCIKNQNFVFRDSSSIAYGTINRTWKFGDSTTGNSQNQSKTFAYPKTYTIWLLQASAKGCMDSVSKKITVYPKPYPSFAINNSAQCLRGNLFRFKNKTSITSGTLTHSWQFGDNQTGNGDSVFHKYANFGTFNVKIISKSNFNCIDSNTSNIFVYPMPKAGFAVNDSQQCLRQNRFVFTNTTLIPNGTLNYKWNFGDTGNSTQISPVHIYPIYTAYKVKLIATSAFLCADTITKTMIVDPMPVAAFAINDSAQCINNQSFVFTDKSSIVYGKNIRRWQFPDSFGTAAIVVRKFNLDTNYSIKLIQTSNQGCMDSVSHKVVIHSKPNPFFAVNAQEQCVRQNHFIFKNNSTIKKGTMLYHWDFGNGKSSDSLQAMQDYVIYGNYKVLLKATSDKACTDTVSATVKVNPMPLADFTINDTGQCINNQLFIYTNKSSIPIGILNHLWKYGNGGTSILANTNVTYAKDTVYNVWLIETSDRGCIDSIKKMVDVYPKPNVKFTINDSVQCLRQNNYIFTNKSNIKYGSITYLWKYGDADTSTKINPTHIYKNYGKFDIVLKGISNLGCVDTLKQIATVGAMPQVDYTVNDPGQCFQTQKFIFSNISTLGSGTFYSIWYYGDGVQQKIKDSSHVWGTTGNFKPRLVVTTNYGCMDSVSHNVWINPNSKAQFTTNDSDQCKNQQNYIFTNSSTVSSGKIKNLLWNLGNGKTSTLNQVGSYYPLSGTYQIKLFTTTDSGCVDSFKNLIRVYPKPAAWFIVNDSAQCLYQNNYQFSDVSFDSFGINIYAWNINGENFQKTKQANYKFASSGYKNITLISTSLRGCSDTIQRKIYVKPMPDARFEKLNSYYCELTGPYSFLPNTPGGNYSGKNIAANIYNPVILWNDSVKYTVTVNGCTDSSVQLTKVYPGPKVNLGNDTTLCKYERLDLVINSWQSTYIWDNGSTNPIRRITEPGRYYVTVSNICGNRSDTIAVQFRNINCRFFLPNAFTPNNDGLNDKYKPVTFDIQEMTYSIYTRWGEKVYEGHKDDSGWDGTYKGENVPNGTFVVYVSYKYDLGYRQVRETATGTVQLMR